MSRTMKKNGQRVYDAMSRLTGEGRGTGWEKCGTARVAEAAGVSKPTARKYLNIMREHGIVSKVVFAAKTELWSWIKEN